MENTYTRFIHMQGQARKDAMRLELSGAPHNIDFSRDVFTLSFSQRAALCDMAKAVGYRKSPGSYHTLGGAFYGYLQRNVAAADVEARKESNKVNFEPNSAKRWDNHNIARG